jgi:hypothetical protein
MVGISHGGPLVVMASRLATSYNTPFLLWHTHRKIPFDMFSNDPMDDPIYAGGSEGYDELFARLRNCSFLRSLTPHA